jgi:hypothetical protein
VVKRHLKYLLFIFNFFLFGVSCDTTPVKIEKPEKFSFQISYAGNRADGSIETINFSDSCKEGIEIIKPNNGLIFNYQLEYEAFLKIKKLIMQQDLTGKDEDNTSFIKIFINKKQNYFLNQEGGIKVINKLLAITAYKDNEQLKEYLGIYLYILKHWS